MSKLIRMPVLTVQKSTGFLCIPDDVDTNNEQALHAACVEAMAAGNVSLLDDGVHIEDADEAVDFFHIQEGNYRAIPNIASCSEGTISTHNDVVCVRWNADNSKALRIVPAKYASRFIAVRLMDNEECVGVGIWLDGWFPTPAARAQAPSESFNDADSVFFGDAAHTLYAVHVWSDSSNSYDNEKECDFYYFAVSLKALFPDCKEFELLTYFSGDHICGMEVIKTSYMALLKGGRSDG